MLDKSSAVGAVNEIDKANFDNISNGLGAMALLPDDVEKLYVQHQIIIGRHPISAEACAACALFVLGRKHLALGTTSLFRLYSAQMYRESRSAVEGAGIARLIQIDADSYKVFIDDDGSKNARKKTRKAFSPAALFSKCAGRYLHAPCETMRFHTTHTAQWGHKNIMTVSPSTLHRQGACHRVDRL